MSMSIRIIQADVMAGLAALEDQSVQCVVTSPPYWGLRDYGVEGQIGLEKTPEEYVQRMVEVFREVKRVLRDDGTLWLNIGDCYCNSNGFVRASEEYQRKGRNDAPANDRNLNELHNAGFKTKDLIGIPWRLAFALQADGWYLRSDIIWSKPNPMPESVTDRPTKSHEYVFLLTKKAKYFYDVDAVREDHSEATFKRAKSVNNADARKDKGSAQWQGGLTPEQQNRYYANLASSSGRNRRTVWEIATQPTTEAHFATFPEALVEPCIKAGTSERGCCSGCGAPWVRVVNAQRILRDELPKDDPRHRPSGYTKRETTGWQPTCTCSAEVIPCTVLDPFGGSGTVAKVARRLHRDAILIEINPAYVEIMKKCLRLNEQLFEDNQIEVIA